MVHTKSSEGKKLKPRGRPFPKGNKRGKLEDNVLDAPGCESSLIGAVIAPEPQSLNGEAANGLVVENLHEVEGMIMPIDETKPVHYEESPNIGCIEPGTEIQVESLLPQPMPIGEPVEVTDKTTPANQVIDTIEFTKGNDKLTIVLSKKHNRMFRVQVFLNGTTEMRPGTYTGASPAMSFWNLLKGSLNG
jgi:hypothetical protein